MRPPHPPETTPPAAPAPPARPATRPRRLTALILLLCAVGAGLAIHYGSPRGTVSDISGDLLYAVAAYLAVVIVAPRLRPLAVGAIAATWCVLIEVFQLTGIPLAAGIAFPPAMLVLGTVFDPRDIALYLGAAAALTLVDTVVSWIARRAASRTRSHLAELSENLR